MHSARNILIGLATLILYATSNAADFCDINLNPRMFSLNPETAVMGRMDFQFSYRDYLEEFIALDGRAYSRFTLSHWERQAGPISTRVLEFLKSFPELAQKLENNRKYLTIDVRMVKVGKYEFPDFSRERKFHMDGIANFRAGVPVAWAEDIYIFAISPGEKLVSPTTFFTGTLPPWFLTHVHNNRRDFRSVLLPPEVEKQVYLMKNGELVRMSGYTLHRRTQAEEAGLRYWVRIVFNKP